MHVFMIFFFFFFIYVCKGRDLVIWSGHIGWHGRGAGEFCFSVCGERRYIIYYFVEDMAYCSFLRKCSRLLFC